MLKSAFFVLVACLLFGDFPPSLNIACSLGAEINRLRSDRQRGRSDRIEDVLVELFVEDYIFFKLFKVVVFSTSRHIRSSSGS